MSSTFSLIYFERYFYSGSIVINYVVLQVTIEQEKNNNCNVENSQKYLFILSA